MRSIVAVTNEMDDAEVAVGELVEQINARGPLGKNSCGFVFCDVEMTHEDFMARLKEKLPFDIVGCTSIANFDTNNGATILSSVLTVLTGDDVRFGTALTDAINAGNIKEELEKAYKTVIDAAGGRGEILFLTPPFNNVVPLDEYVNILDELSGGTPIFGGLPSSNLADGDILMFANGKVHSDRAVLVLISGDVKPVFSVQNFLSEISQHKHIVTGAEKNVIRTVEGMTFVDYLRHLGMPVDTLIAQGDLAIYVSTPLKVYLSSKNERDKIPVARTIKTLNPEDGSGVLFGAISENSAISIVTMKRQDIQASCNMAIREIKEKIAAASEDGRKYSTVICISCGGRYMVMGEDKAVEGYMLKGNIPEDLTISGFYAYGEICPTIVENGRALNRVHNESIVICAM
ncbi:MAG: FIST C-terminal domain-containing protein [Synergistaceae bacterium]|jgi:hypothetical protein|nr:FIST C-terminal domain-containing protein [Synergistaceae bacterium]